MKPGELYLKTEYNTTYITLVTEVDVELNTYKYIHFDFDHYRARIDDVYQSRQYCGPLETSGLVSYKPSIDLWRMKILNLLQEHPFDINQIIQLWKDLDRSVPIAYTVGQYTRENDKLILSGDICKTIQGAETLCEKCNKENEYYPRMIYLVVPLFEED